MATKKKADARKAKHGKPKTIRRSRRKLLKRAVRLKRQRPQRSLMPPRQVAVRAQELAFQLLVAVDRGAVVEKFVRSYARDQKRPGRISNPGRYRDLIETIRREVFLLITLQIEDESSQRLGGRLAKKTSTAERELTKLFRDEFYFALRRSLELSEHEFGEFCRDVQLYRSLQINAGGKSRLGPSAPAGPFVDRCGFLLDSPLLDQGRRAAAKFESELHAAVSSVVRRVFARRS